MYEFEFHAAQAMMEVRACGTWSAETVERFRRDSLAARADRDRLKFLVDCRHSEVQPEETAERMRTLADDRRPGDRIAVLVSSSLAKLQARRVLEGWGEAEVFLSENAARTWLHAHDAHLLAASD